MFLSEKQKEIDELFTKHGLTKVDKGFELDYFVGPAGGNGLIFGEVFRLFTDYSYRDKVVVFNNLRKYNTDIIGNNGETWLFNYVPTKEMKDYGYDDNCWLMYDKKCKYFLEQVIKSVIKQYKDKMNELNMEKIENDFK
jgi:hypothetical protein